MLKFDWNILFTLINLVIFYLLMKKFLFGRILKVMDKRKEMIDNDFKEAGEATEKADSLKKEYEEKIENAQSDADAIIAKAQENAKDNYNRIIKKAEDDAAEIKATAEKQAQIDSENQVRQAREQIASLAMETAQKIIGESVSVKSDSDIYDEFLNGDSDNDES